MSGYTDDTIGHHRLREPGTFFLNKPFTMEELDAKLRLALTRALSSPS